MWKSLSNPDSKQGLGTRLATTVLNVAVLIICVSSYTIQTLQDCYKRGHWYSAHNTMRDTIQTHNDTPIYGDMNKSEHCCHYIITLSLHFILYRGSVMIILGQGFQGSICVRFFESWLRIFSPTRCHGHNVFMALWCTIQDLPPRLWFSILMVSIQHN